MLATVSASSLSLTTYDRKGQAIALARSQPATPVPRLSQAAETTGLTGTDAVDISAEGRRMAQQESQAPQDPATEAGRADDVPANPGTAGQAGKPQSAEAEMTAAEQQMVRELKARDTEVRDHEMAHLASAGPYARGGPTYTYQQGPDGRGYAVGGEVPIDIGKEATPEATIAKMQIVKRAALAPANPSGADQQIASAATAQEMQAHQELQQAAGGQNQTRTSKRPTSAASTTSSPAASGSSGHPASATGTRRLAMDLFA